ncbi:DUF6318 family protein [Nesterenkonia aerolata]|uniref:DUF6318 family protein n=1 Tax=Nesterenkonia aerolata TaxID=3074079 RepID=A0ABU2DR16_9MICC|nr:DUF6318 family protein [Nesterenkonia sp. LY-0111]MDR8018861.1 DUF6318 family protein [Nesterenkonia sp. LY-0111]
MTWRLRTAASAVALGLLLISCGDEGEPDESDAESTAPAEAVDEDSVEDDAAEERSDDEDSSDDGADSREPVPASSSGPAENWPEPEKPDAMFEDTEEGAVAALEYWWAGLHHARNTGDTGPVREVSGEDCAICKNEIDVTTEVYEQDAWWVQDEYSVNMTDIWGDTDEIVVVAFSLTSGAFESYTDQGLQEEVEGQSDLSMEADLAFDGQWSVLQLEIMDEPEE